MSNYPRIHTRRGCKSHITRAHYVNNYYYYYTPHTGAFSTIYIIYYVMGIDVYGYLCNINITTHTFKPLGHKSQMYSCAQYNILYLQAHI